MQPLSTYFQWGSSQRETSNARLASDSNGIESGITLQDVQRPSTETTRRNGFRQSVAPDRATRIMEDIMNGKYVLQFPILSGTKIHILIAAAINVPFALRH
jgi:hypothetical protein